MMQNLQSYEPVVGQAVIDQLEQLARPLAGMKVVHVNSTRAGGGVAEILEKMVPFMSELGMDCSWEVIQGDASFYATTKTFHNALQGRPQAPREQELRHYEEVNAENARTLEDTLRDADFVFIHDPQPAALLAHFPDRMGQWIWRCHIDLSHPFRPVWKYLRDRILDFEASVFSLPDFAQVLPHPVFIIPPSIDPLGEKNIELSQEEVRATTEALGIDPERPSVVQISRFDRFKDPIGVIQAYRLARRFSPDLQLILAGGGASDDPEGEAVLQEVRAAAEEDPGVHILPLSGEEASARTVNALQRRADIVMQKSLKEGFGLTVTEGMWKGRPVIGGNAGGIRLQVVNHQTGFLVDTPEGAALRIRYLLFNEDERVQMGLRAKEFVRENFLITRHLQEYLTIMVALHHQIIHGRIEL